MRAKRYPLFPNRFNQTGRRLGFQIPIQRGRIWDFRIARHTPEASLDPRVVMPSGSCTKSFDSPRVSLPSRIFDWKRFALSCRKGRGRSSQLSTFHVSPRDSSQTPKLPTNPSPALNSRKNPLFLPCKSFVWKILKNPSLQKPSCSSPHLRSYPVILFRWRTVPQLGSLRYKHPRNSRRMLFICVNLPQEGLASGIFL